MISQILYGETPEILETENFSKIKMDFDGYEGWINSSILKNKMLKFLKCDYAVFW